MNFPLRGGLFCLVLLAWRVASNKVDDWMIGCLMGLAGLTVLPLAVKERFFGGVLCCLSCGAFGIEEIVKLLKISLFLLILFGLMFNIQPFGGAQIIPNSLVVTSI